MLDIKVLGWLTLRFWAAWLPEPKCLGCPRYNFSCTDIIQTAEILADWNILVFASEESNCTEKINKLGLAFFVPINFVSRIVLQSCETRNRSILPTENNSHDKICGPVELDTGNYLTQLVSVGFHERDLASVKNFNGKD